MEFICVDKPSTPCVASMCMHEGRVFDSSCHRGMQAHRFEGSSSTILLVSPTPALPRCMVCNGSSMRWNAPRPPHFLTSIGMDPSLSHPGATAPSFPPSPPSLPPREGASASWVHLPLGDQVRSPPSLSLRLVGCDEVNSIENSKCGISLRRFAAARGDASIDRRSEACEEEFKTRRSVGRGRCCENEREEACHVHAAVGPSKKREVHRPSKDHDV